MAACPPLRKETTAAMPLAVGVTKFVIVILPMENGG
jgi:hypothetical protein